MSSVLATPISDRTGHRFIRAVAVVAPLLVCCLLAVAAISGTACADPAPTPTPAASAPVPPPPPPVPPLPLPTMQGCTADSPLPVCHLPATPTPPSGCSGPGCLAPPDTTAAPESIGPTGESETGDSGSGVDADCGLLPSTWPGCFQNMITGYFRGIVSDALNPLLDALSTSLLTTPLPDRLPRVGELWASSWQILLACYGLLILLAGLLIMGYQTVQTRYTIKEIAPRIIVGFLAGTASLWAATQAILIANALAFAVMGGGVDPTSAGDTLRHMVAAPGQGMWLLLLVLVLIALVVVLLVTYIIRVACTVILIVAAPLALMCHALPQTAGVASWWWRAFGGCLAIQICQSLTLITAIKVFLAPGGFTALSLTTGGLVNILIAIALVWVLVRIPFWILRSVRGGRGHRTMLGSLMRGVIAYKTFGLLRGHRGHYRGSGNPRGGTTPGSRGGPSRGGGRGAADPYARVRTTAAGQYVLPLAGVRRTRTPTTPQPAPGRAPRGRQGRQLTLPLGDDWPEHKPVLGRDGQYRLPMNVTRLRPPAPPPPTDQPGTNVQRHGEPYQDSRPTRSRQDVPLAPNVHRRRPATPATPPARSTPRGRQLSLPLDLPKLPPARPSTRPDDTAGQEGERR